MYSYNPHVQRNWRITREHGIPEILVNAFLNTGPRDYIGIKLLCCVLLFLKYSERPNRKLVWKSMGNYQLVKTKTFWANPCYRLLLIGTRTNIHIYFVVFRTFLYKHKYYFSTHIIACNFSHKLQSYVSNIADSLIIYCSKYYYNRSYTINYDYCINIT